MAFFVLERGECMSQVINLTLPNVAIPIPEDMLLVDKVEFEKLKRDASEGRWMDIKEILEMLSISRGYLYDLVLLNPRYKDKIDISKNPKTGFVSYPESQGGKYLFLASRAKPFFEKNFAEILLDRGR